MLRKKSQFMFSLLFAIALTVQSMIHFTGDIDQRLLEDTFTFSLVKQLCVFCAGLAAAWLVFSVMLRLAALDREKHFLTCFPLPVISKGKAWLLWSLYTGSIWIMYFLFFLLHYPGYVLDDSISSLMQITGQMGYSNHHPVIYTLFVGVFVKLGYTLTGSYNIGVAIYSAVQLTIISGAMGFIMLSLRRHGVRQYVMVLIWLYLTVNNLFSLYSIVMWKDPLFSVFLLLFVWVLYEKGTLEDSPVSFSSDVLLCILLFLTAFFRNNGIYISLFMIPLIIIRYSGKKRRRRTAIAILLTGILILVIRYPVFTLAGVNTSHAEESVAIPMQQIAYTIHDGNSIVQSDEIDAIMPLEKWGEEYRPFRADFIKWAPDFNTEEMNLHTGRFLSDWASGLKDNFAGYVKAYLMETYGYYTVNTRDSYSYTYYFRDDNDWELHQSDLLSRAGLGRLAPLFSMRWNISAGSLVWILFLCLFLLLSQRRLNAAFALIPLVLLWATIMIAAPVAFSLRYVLALAYALPVLLLMPFLAD